MKHPKLGWMDVGHVDGGLVVNTGLQLEMWTAGTLPATLHRVLAPPVERERARQSLVYFIGAEEDALVQPAMDGPRRAEFEERGAVRSGEHIRALLEETKFY